MYRLNRHTSDHFVYADIGLLLLQGRRFSILECLRYEYSANVTSNLQIARERERPSTRS